LTAELLKNLTAEQD